MKHSEVDGTTHMRTLAQVGHQCSSSSSLLHIPGASRGVISSVHGGGPAPSGESRFKLPAASPWPSLFLCLACLVVESPQDRTKASLRITTGLSLVWVKPAVHSPRGHGRHFGKPPKSTTKTTTTTPTADLLRTKDTARTQNCSRTHSGQPSLPGLRHVAAGRSTSAWPYLF